MLTHINVGNIHTFHLFLKFIFLFMAVLGLRCHAGFFSSCSKQGLLCAVLRLLIVVASLVAEHGL